jgi:signal transduction histidine kinase
MRRLYIQIYFTFLGILVLLGLLASLTWLWLSPRDVFRLDSVAWLAEQLLPGPQAPREELEKSLGRLQARFEISLALSDAQGRLLASAGDALPAPDPSWREGRFLRSRGRGLTMALRLSDGRFLVLRHHRRSHGIGAVTGMLLAALAVSLGAYPLVRRLTRRLERLQARVDALGEGRLGARVEVEGADEVARLADSFNRAASRIERLVEAERALLTGASHELRSPLTRIRMATELLSDRAPADLRDRIEKDVAELDDLIGELILASRIEAHQAIQPEERIDVLAMAAEEASRYQAAVSGAPAEIRGDRSLVRRLLRNLLENARRHAPGSEIEIDVRPAEPERGARIRVMDRGAGVPEAERESVFEPFYQLQGVPRSSEKGVGLGLALVRKIARLHGGDARCAGRDGGGSVFEVELFDVV